MILGEAWNLSARDIARTLGKEFKEVEDKIFNTIMKEDDPSEEIIENVLEYVRRVIS